MRDIFHQIQAILGLKDVQWQALSGGDTSSAFLARGKSNSFFVKMSTRSQASGMFEVEAQSMDYLYKKGVPVPKVVLNGQIASTAYLILDYVEEGRADAASWKSLGDIVVGLHQIEGKKFGWELDNFIGPLPQINTYESDWATFYTQYRLKPQFDLALRKGLLEVEEIPDEAKMYSFLFDLFSSIRPRLLHGDLWSGNFLFDSIGQPYLIDPAIYYGDRLVDLAMSQLFGGFDSVFYKRYYESFPQEAGFKERIDIYQLYYLMVHLNLFGGGYYHQMRRILERYF